MEIAGKRVLLTGGSSGIGLALASELLDHGARVTLVARTRARLARAGRLLRRRHPGRVWTACCDLRDPLATAATVRRAIASTGGLEILVNNAGVGLYGPAGATTVEDARALIETNYLATVGCTLTALPHLRRQRSGLVINIVSLAALYGVPYLAAYGASKAAMACFAQALRHEMRPFALSVLNVYPDYTETPFFTREQRRGAARRPPPPYRPAAEVARSIVEAIVANRTEVVTSARGKLLRLLGGLAPGLVDRLMRAMAQALSG